MRMEIYMKVNIRITRLEEMEFLSIRMEESMKVCLWVGSFMEKEYL